MSTTLKTAVDKIIGEYHPLVFSIYAILLVGIESSEYGEYHFTSNSLLLRLSYKTGRRPTRVSSMIIRKAIHKLWEDGLLDFKPHNKGNIVRMPNITKDWKTFCKIV